MTGYVQEGATVSAAAPYAVGPYDGALLGDLFGVSLGSYQEGADGEFATVGVFRLEKWTGAAWTRGEAVYWDDDARECTVVASGNTLIGCAYAAAAFAADVALVRLNGSAVPLIRVVEGLITAHDHDGLYLPVGSPPVLTGDGTVWDDLVFEMTPTRRGATDKPDFDATNNGLLFPQNDPAEILYINVQMPHRWKEGSIVYPHVHWHQTANQTPVFKLDYRWCPLGGAVPSWTTGFAMSHKVFTYAAGTLHQISTNSSGLSGSGNGMSAMLQLKFYRDDNAYTGDALVTSFDLHIECDGIGSVSELSKA